MNSSVSVAGKTFFKMDNKKTIEKLIEILEEIKESDLLVIVEGKKDVNALKKFGIKSVKLRGNLPQFCEHIQKSHKEVILLMDSDKEGRKLASILSKNLERLRVKTNKKYISILRNLGISHVEGIPRFVKRRSKNFD